MYKFRNAKKFGAWAVFLCSETEFWISLSVWIPLSLIVKQLESLFRLFGWRGRLETPPLLLLSREQVQRHQYPPISDEEFVEFLSHEMKVIHGEEAINHWEGRGYVTRGNELGAVELSMSWRSERDHPEEIRAGWTFWGKRNKKEVATVLILVLPLPAIWYEITNLQYGMVLWQWW